MAKNPQTLDSKNKNKYLKKQRKLTLRYKLHLIWKKWKEVWQ